LGDTATLQHDVLDAVAAEVVAHGEASLAGADDDRIDGAWHVRCSSAGRRRRPVGRRRRRPVQHVAVTETGTPLVSTSKTAERATAWSTTFCSVSAGASPF